MKKRNFAVFPVEKNLQEKKNIDFKKGLVELAKLIREIRKEGAVLPPTPENINKVKKDYGKKPIIGKDLLTITV